MNKRLSVYSPSRVLRSALFWALLSVLLSNAQTAAFVIPRNGLFARDTQENAKGLSAFFNRQLRSPRVPHFQTRQRRKITYTLFVNLTVPERPVVQDEQVVLQCLASGPKPSVVYWLKDGKRVSQNDGEIVDMGNDSNDGKDLTLTQVRSKLFIDCASPEDEAEYTCVAVSSEGMDSASYKLQVSNSPNLLSTTKCRSHSKKSLRHHSGAPARITMWTYNKFAPLGANVVLVCHGSPNSVMTWSSDDTSELVTEMKNPRVRVLDNGNLEIDDIRWSDMGGYACTVENDAGSDRQVAFLYPYAR